MGNALTAENLAKQAKAAYQKGEYLEAAQSYQAASEAYRIQADPLRAAEMANNASVAYLQANEAGLAFQAVEGTAETFLEAGDLSRQGMALGNKAAALEALDQVDEALAYYQQSADVLAEAGEDQLRASVMQSLSMLQFRSGRQLQALASMQDGLEAVQKPNPKQRFLKKLLRIPIDMVTRNKSS